MNRVFTYEAGPAFFKLLAHEVRWKIVTFLARSDYNGQELIGLLKQPQNLVSYHLRLLSEQHLITERRNSADERSIYYSLDLGTLRTLYRASGESLHPFLGQEEMSAPLLQQEGAVQPGKPVRVLFLCTQNSARSQMAEGILRDLSQGQIEVSSAGSHPTHLHPLAIQASAAQGIDIHQQWSKHLDELVGKTFDYMITVCDRVREACPTFPGDPTRIHWSFPDPALVEGTEEERSHAFEQTALQLMTRIRYLLILIEREKGLAL